jgi:hypothetical protein
MVIKLQIRPSTSSSFKDKLSPKPRDRIFNSKHFHEFWWVTIYKRPRLHPGKTLLKRRKNYTSEQSVRARGLKGPHPEANQPKRPRNTPPTNQRLAHGFKGPQTWGNCLNLPPTTMYPLGDPPGSVQDERWRERGHPGVGRTLGSAEPGRHPVSLSFGGK